MFLPGFLAIVRRSPSQTFNLWMSSKADGPVLDVTYEPYCVKSFVALHETKDIEQDDGVQR